MSGDVVARARAVQSGVTDGPWSWTTPQYGVPELMGRAGDPETYEYDTEVLEASHSGECGCRSACELELSVSDADRAFIAAARSLVPELVAEVEKLRRGGMELGRIIERQCLDVLEITGLHHMIDADGDGDWGLVWERLAEMAAAGAEVEKLRGALETIRDIATGPRDFTFRTDILAVIERAGIES